MIRIRQIKIRVDKWNINNLLLKVCQILKIKKDDILDFKIYKQSIDARIKSDVCYSFIVDVLVNNEEEILKNNQNANVSIAPKEEFVLPKKGHKKMANRLVIVGCGPAGLFAGYILSKNGYKPLIIERGKKIEERVDDVKTFWQTGKLLKDSNVLFGEGGAGTFSDGKLNTLTKDKNFLNKKVLEIFALHGANENITYVNNPHIGTDNLQKIVVNIREDIIKNGGEILFNTKLTDIKVVNGSLESITLNDEKEIPCNNLILALGHSARDTFRMLYKRGLQMEAKPFAVGLRVMHSQKMIDEWQYGKFAKYLKSANYKLTMTSKNKRGVYSFCMCPGGYVVNSSSEKGKLAINGMSYYKRDSAIANSAIVVSVNKKDFQEGALKGMEFQEKLEKKAYDLAKGKIPVSLWKDYQHNQISKEFKTLKPKIKGEYQFANLNEIFPKEINDSIKEAMVVFDKKIHGFASDDTIMAGVESRTSSPIRMIRDENYVSNIKGIYPCGEGSGYSGGITTSAMDGIKVACHIIATYKN